MEQKPKVKIKINLTMVILWVIIALISAVATWVFLMAEDTKMLRTSPHSVIPPVTESTPSTETRESSFQQQTVPLSEKRLSIVISQVGLQRDLTLSAIENLPGAVTLSFSPYAKDKQTMIAKARAMKHQIMMDLPITNLSNQHSDGGPEALDATETNESNLQKVKHIINGCPGLVGLNCYDPNPQSEILLNSLIPLLSKEKIIFLAQLGNTTTLPSGALTPLVFHEDATEDILQEQLSKVEQSLSSQNHPVLLGQASPLLIKTLSSWCNSLASKGIQLVPIADLMSLQNNTEH